MTGVTSGRNATEWSGKVGAYGKLNELLVMKMMMVKPLFSLKTMKMKREKVRNETRKSRIYKCYFTRIISSLRSSERTGGL